MDFEWDEDKAFANEQKHGVTFAEAAEVFGDQLSRSVPDPDHSRDEERFLIFGATAGGRNLVVSYSETEARIRLISAREMTRQERRAYELE
ncbi:MAG: BrnT family toxin [Burkholderiales bacterium]